MSGVFTKFIGIHALVIKDQEKQTKCVTEDKKTFFKQLIDDIQVT